MYKIILIIVYCFLTTPLFAHQNHDAHLGKISFPTTGSQEAQSYFERGVMLLHSFEYSAARTDFIKAQTIDPQFAMAYWGEAMTYNPPLWNEQNYQQGKKVLNKLATTASAPVTKSLKEKGFIHAINILYGNGDKKSRDMAYMKVMRDLYQQYPDDDEIASFYALSLLGSTQDARNLKNYAKAGSIAEKVFQNNACHPGALHYLLHAYDDPEHAHLGLKAAKIYSDAAPDASHALHMPSHIYIAFGFWDEVITTNKAAWEAGVKQNVTHDPKNFTVHDLHALQWLIYAYLQKQQYMKAYTLTKTLEDIAIKSATPMAKWYYAMTRAAYIIESKNWGSNLQSLDMSKVEISARITNMYIDAIIALQQNANINEAKRIYQTMQQSIPNTLKNDTFEEYFTSIGANGIKLAKIMAIELDAQIKRYAGDKTTAIMILKHATQDENNIPTGYGPPVPIKPLSELFADVLMEDKQYHAAFEQYRQTLKRFPNRLAPTQALALEKTHPL